MWWRDLIFTVIKKMNTRKLRMHIDFYPDNNRLENCAYIFTIWQVGSISNTASRCLSKNHHIPRCMENLNQQQSQKHTFCQRMNIHMVASTTQVELNTNANNCYNFILIFCLTATSKIKIQHDIG